MNAPDGAMDEALNVVIRREGMAKPRDAFAGAITSGLGRMDTIEPFDGDMLISTQGVLAWYSDHTTNLDDAAGDQIATSLTQGAPMTEARGNLYVGTDDGVHKFTAAADAASQQVGILFPPAILVNKFAGSSVLGTEVAVAYRVTITRTDANGVVVVSAPSARHVYDNQHTVSTYDAAVSVVTGHLLAGDVVKAFRSREVATGVLPSDDLYLATQYTLVAADISNGSVGIPDATLEENLGEPLYTNPTREKFVRANVAPPHCESMALYKDSLFFGNTIHAQSIQLRADMGGFRLMSSDKIGERRETGSVSGGSNSITGLVDTSGIKVGMIVDHSTGFTSLTTVTVVNASDVSVSRNADAGVTTESFSFWDSFRIDNDYYRAPPHLAADMQSPANATSSGPAGYHVLSADMLALTRNDGATDLESEQEVFNASFLIRQDKRSGAGASFDVYATNGDQYSPPLNEPDGVATTSEGDDFPNAIYFSKKNQPEHVPLGNFLRVGAESHPIQRIVAARDALWVFKTDGVYRLTGQGELTGWRVDAYDPSAYLIHRRYAVELDGDVFAWTGKGIMLYGERGDSNISRGSIGNLLADHEEDFGVDSNGLEDEPACWADPSKHEVYFHNPNTSHTYVFNVKTGTWVRWQFLQVNDSCGEPRCGTWNPADGKSYIGTNKGTPNVAYILKQGQAETDIVEAQIKWTHHTDDPGVVSRFREVAILWDDRAVMPSTWEAVFDSSVSASTTGVTVTDDGGTQPTAVRVFVPRNHGVGTRLGVRLDVDQTDGEQAKDWAITGIRIVSDPITTAVSK